MSKAQKKERAAAEMWLKAIAVKFIKSSTVSFDDFIRRFQIKNWIVQQGDAWMIEHLVLLGLSEKTAKCLNGFAPIDVICAGYQSGDLDLAHHLRINRTTISRQALWAFIVSKASSPDAGLAISSAVYDAIGCYELITQGEVDKVEPDDLFQRILVPLAEKFGWNTPVPDDGPPPTVFEGRGKSNAPQSFDVPADIERRAPD